jgi:hypothetical protein
VNALDQRIFQDCADAVVKAKVVICCLCASYVEERSTSSLEFKFSFKEKVGAKGGSELCDADSLGTS